MMKINTLKQTILGLLVVMSFFLLQGLKAKDMTNKNLGKILQVQKIATGLEIKSQNAYIKVLFYSENIVRIRIDDVPFTRDFSYAITKKPQPINYTFEEKKAFYTLRTKAFLIKIQKASSAFSFYTLDGRLINEDNAGLGTMWTGEEIATYKTILKKERFIGLGEKTGPLDRRNQSYTNWNTDAYGYGAWQDPIYASIPFYMGIHHNLVYGIFFDSTYESEFNFGASNNRFAYFSARGGEMDYYFIYDKGVGDIINHYTYLTGRATLPPLWSLGYIQSRYSYYPDTEVLRIANTLREKKIPADGIVLDIHHMDGYKVFTWNKKYFPEPKKLIDSLSALNLQVTTIVNPGIKILKGYQPYDDGVKNDIFIKYPDNTYYAGEVWPGWCNFTDFTAAKGRNWWAEKMKFLVNYGVKGFWTDMNEIATWGQRMPANVVFDFDGEKATHRKARNVYGMQMSRATYQGTKKSMNQERPFLLTRAAYAGGQRYTALWTGDNRSESDHMLAGVRLLYSLGLSGYPFTGMDIGGFTGNPPIPLYIRWVQLGAFTPFFRSHTGINTKPSEPWNYGEEATEIARNYIKLRYRLMPYIYSHSFQATQNGMPLFRSLAIDYSFEDRVYQWPYLNQFLFGHALMVVPYKPEKNIKKVFFPNDIWYNLYNDTIIQGNQEQWVTSNLHTLPVYVRGSSIIPMQSQIFYLHEKTDEILYLHIYNGSKENKLLYYEDDGKTFDYENEVYYQRKINFSPANKQLNFSQVKGKYTSKFKKIKLILHGFDSLKNIKIGSTKIKVVQEKVSFVDPISNFSPGSTVNKTQFADVKTILIDNSKNNIKIKW